MRYVVHIIRIIHIFIICVMYMECMLWMSAIWRHTASLIRMMFYQEMMQDGCTAVWIELPECCI